MKRIKGITLISLVITIIILIILASVSINLTVGENGIFNKAKYAKEDYNNAVIVEEEELKEIYNNVFISENEQLNEKNNKSYTYIGGTIGMIESGMNWSTIKGEVSINDKVVSVNDGIFTFNESGTVVVYTFSKAHYSAQTGSGGKLYHNSTVIYSEFSNEIYRKDEINIEKGDIIYLQAASKNNWALGGMWMYFK